MTVPEHVTLYEVKASLLRTHQLQALDMLGVLDSIDEPLGMGDKVRWRYSVAEGIEPLAVGP